MADRLSPTLKAVSDAMLAVAAEVSVDEVLQRLVDSARELAGARYAALGLPDGDGGFRRFLTSGMSERLIASLGPLPRQHGVLGAMLETQSSYRTGDIHDHPRFLALLRRLRITPVWTPTEASWLNLIEAQFGVLRRFTLANTDDSSHRVRRYRVYRYLRYRHRALSRLRHPLNRIRGISPIKLEQH